MRNLIVLVQLSLSIILLANLQVLGFCSYQSFEKQQISQVNQIIRHNSEMQAVGEECNFKDYTFVIKANKNLYVKGEEVILEVELTNKNPLFIRASANDVNISNKVEVRNSRKNILLFSETGKAKMDKIQELYSLGSSFATEISQDEIYNYKINLSNFYNLSIGTYTIKVNREIGVRNVKTNKWCKLPISSNSLKIEIK